MRIDVSWELGRLLVYVADVATAIRLNSPYGSDYKDRDLCEVGFDVLHLSDSLHCLDRLGRAIQSGDSRSIVMTCDALLSHYRTFMEGAQGRGEKGDPKASFERYGHLCRPQEAMAVFTDIRAKALDLEDAMDDQVARKPRP